MAEQRHTLLICTVGGTPEPVIAALKRWKPVRVRFVHTPQTKGDVDAKIVPKARDEGVDLDPGRYDLFELPDGQDLASCLDRLRQLTPKVMDWVARGDKFQVVVDFTGGTKCMSASIALQASRWPCLFSYVGGSERTKDGVGVVVSGAEKVVCQANPWDALGHQAVEEFVVLFDQRAFLAAANVAEVAKKRVTLPDRKREFSVLEQLARAFDAWDRFDHSTSRALLEQVTRSANDLRAALTSAHRVLDAIESSRAHLDEICRTTPPSRAHVLDLLANAKRRRDEGRVDDGVARLYRAIEATAQLALKERHGIESTARVPLDRIPEPPRSEWAARAKEGVVAIGLQDAYRLLMSFKDPLGEKFESAALHGTKSPLVARNQSILAHGFECVREKIFDDLWKAALSLADVVEADLPSFPVLGDRGEN
ncbi:MAG: TIGR02710 family CRISPR-associated CARF protein [Myxococcota bacterium]|nr:TIGR02710 family CRISPR-associated CARF protein [Myxococcota bacterium]MDW8363850.1 TIGR02710 family CRISPR-associated CARF protein [Myxococcales bacterium]